MAVEAKRGCGYRRQGGLYLVGGGLSAPCDRMPYPLDRCKTCGGGIKFTRGHTWLQPDFFPVHDGCHDDCPCPVCGYVGANQDGVIPSDDFGPHLLLWIGRGHYSPEAFLEEGRRLGVSRRISAMPKGLVLGETWVLLAHLDAVPSKLAPDECGTCGKWKRHHGDQGCIDVERRVDCVKFEPPKPTPGIFCAFIPRAVELVLRESDATPERVEKEAKRGVSVVRVPDDDRDHQGSVWDKDEDSQPELPVES